MDHLQQLSGAVALLLICAILFVEECGVPLPFLPGDVLLAGGGVLVASGRLSLALLIPATTAAMCAGALIGHGWAHHLGRPALQRLAARVGGADHLERASTRLRASGFVGVLLCRLVPGMRVYTNLAAGAAAVPRRTFVAGLVPSVLAWTVGFSLLGMFLGRPVLHALHTLGRALPLSLACVALLLAVAAAVLWIPGHERLDPSGTRRALRVTAAALLDLAVAAAVAAACLEVVEDMLRLGERAGLVAEGLLAGGVLLAYVVVTRRAAGATAGEGLLHVSYRRRRDPAP